MIRKEKQRRRHEINHLKEFRVKKLWTQKELAAASGVSQVTISFIENRKTDPEALTKAKLAHALGVEPEQIWTGEVESQDQGVEFKPGT